LKQKYLITLSPETEKLSIQEYAELEKGEFAFVCEEVYDIDEFKNAMDGGAEGLVSIVRRPNMYPRQDFGERIAQEIINLLNDASGATSSEIFINDRDDFIQEKDDIDPRAVYEEDTEETDQNGDQDKKTEDTTDDSK
jgi:hypothetical protein